jgi:hypothetical protein
VTASQNATAIVDVEIYDQTWHKVYQLSWNNQSFVANRTRSFTIAWTVPGGAASGQYTVMVGTFARGWASAYSFNSNAATFIVP